MMKMVSLLVPLVLLVTGPAAARAALVKAVPFIEDDYAGAVAEARAKRRPLFVEAWASW